MITTIKMAPEGVVLAGSTLAPGSESLTASAGTCAPLAPGGRLEPRGEHAALGDGLRRERRPPGRPAREARPANASGATDLAGPSSRP